MSEDKRQAVSPLRQRMTEDMRMRKGRRDRQARLAARPAARVCHAPARTEGGHPRHPGAARPQEAGLCPDPAYVPPDPRPPLYEWSRCKT